MLKDQTQKMTRTLLFPDIFVWQTSSDPYFSRGMREDLHFPHFPHPSPGAARIAKCRKSDEPALC